METKIGSILFTTESDSKQGYEDFPSFLNDIWPALVANKSSIESIFAFRHKRGSNIILLTEGYNEIEDNIFYLGNFETIPKKKLELVKDMSYYQGDRNIIYKIRANSFLSSFLSKWPHRNEISMGISIMGFDTNDQHQFNSFAINNCSKNSILLTFLHDANTLFAVGQVRTLEKILEGRQPGRP